MTYMAMVRRKEWHSSIFSEITKNYESILIYATLMIAYMKGKIIDFTVPEKNKIETCSPQKSVICMNMHNTTYYLGPPHEL